MAWLKISEGVYALEATPDPAQIIVVAELEKEIAEFELRLAEAQKNLIEIPKGVDERVVELIADKNNRDNAAISQLVLTLQDKNQFLKSLREL